MKSSSSLCGRGAPFPPFLSYVLSDLIVSVCLSGHLSGQDNKEEKHLPNDKILCSDASVRIVVLRDLFQAWRQ